MLQAREGLRGKKAREFEIGDKGCECLRCRVMEDSKANKMCVCVCVCLTERTQSEGLVVL